MKILRLNEFSETHLKFCYTLYNKWSYITNDIHLWHYRYILRGRTLLYADN